MKNVSSSTSTDEERTRLPKLSFKDIELRKRRDPVSLLPAAKVGVDPLRELVEELGLPVHAARLPVLLVVLVELVQQPPLRVSSGEVVLGQRHALLVVVDHAALVVVEAVEDLVDPEVRRFTSALAREAGGVTDDALRPGSLCLG